VLSHFITVLSNAAHAASHQFEDLVYQHVC